MADLHIGAMLAKIIAQLVYKKPLGYVCLCVCVSVCVCVREGGIEKERVCASCLALKKQGTVETVFLALHVQCKNNIHFVSIWTALPGRGCAQ